MAGNLEQSANYQSVKSLAEIEVGFEKKQRAIALHIEN